MKRITSELLIQKCACAVQVACFIECGGDELPLTEELCLEHSEKFSWDWAADNLLVPAALAEYRKSTRTAWTKYARNTYSAGRNRWRIEQDARHKHNRTMEHFMLSVEGAYGGLTAWFRAVPSALTVYENFRDETEKKYARIRDDADAECDRITEPMRKTLARARASAFFQAWSSPENQGTEVVA